MSNRIKRKYEATGQSKQSFLVKKLKGTIAQIQPHVKVATQPIKSLQTALTPSDIARVLVAHCANNYDNYYYDKQSPSINRWLTYTRMFISLAFKTIGPFYPENVLTSITSHSRITRVTSE